MTLSAFNSIKSKRSLVQGTRCAHENGNFPQARVIDQARVVLGDRSRILPRVSGTNPKPSRHPYTGSPGRSDWAPYAGWSHSCISQKMYDKARSSSNRAKTSKGQISPHTQPTMPFPSGCSLLMRVQDDWCQMIKASPRLRAWLGLLRFTLDRLARGCWLLS